MVLNLKYFSQISLFILNLRNLVLINRNHYVETNTIIYLILIIVWLLFKLLM